MSYEQTFRSIFEALARADIDAIVSNFAEDARYTNPMVGAPAEGLEEVRKKLVDLAQGLSERGERLSIDRVTEGPSHVVLEWHVEPGDGSRNGVHIAQFNDEGKIVEVNVYPRL